MNLFSRMIFGMDGYACHILISQAAKSGNVQRRLVSYGHTQRGKDATGAKRKRDRKACPYGVDYKIVERAVLGVLSELKASDLDPPPVATEATVQRKAQELEGIDARMTSLEKELANPGSTSTVPQLTSAIAELRQRRDGVQKEIDSLRQARATAGTNPLGEVHDILAFIASKPAEEQHDLRLRLRSLIGALVEKIEIEPIKEGHFVNCNIYVTGVGTWSRWIRRAADVKPEHFAHPETLMTASSLEELEAGYGGPESFVINPEPKPKPTKTIGRKPQQRKKK